MEVFDLTGDVDDADYDKLSGVDARGEQVFEASPKATDRETYLDVTDNDTVEEPQEEEIVYENTKSVAALRGVLDSKLRQKGYLFEAKQIDKRNETDFSQEISKIGDETTEDKLLRIKEELSQLQLQDDVSFTAAERKRVTALQDLHQHISRNYKQKLDNLQESFQNGLYLTDTTNEVALPNIKLDLTDLQRILDLEKRIHELESILGSNESEEFPTSIISQINEVYGSLKLLQNNDEGKTILQNFHEKLKEVDADYKNSLLGKQYGKDSNLQETTQDKMVLFETKINQLYKSYGLLKNYQDVIPKLSERIRHIDKLNENVSESYHIIQNTDSIISEIKQTAKQWENTINRVEEKLDSQEELANAHFQEIDDKIYQLKTQLDTINKV
ncbi:hypothetical protein NCAS_0F02150 [Naumovozyma castellii]|uniref:Uncharacterized protein n=1 Tax=Naumovozyma castellii TaxID=27288 RepID=G0VGS8_NAUCA|nr:hypothetical protein NCAS_0F02150 [Naumovozyma castellii CBS 4309]CCC70699.1 hypothetical protein NCAS_0F02150 [Naumovozyma castellii CBS 4309]